VSNLAENLAWARRGVLHVFGEISIGASNKASDIAGTLGLTILTVSLMRHTNLVTCQQRIDTLKKARGLDAVAKRWCSGNCQEQATVAFLFLYDRGVRPLDLYELPNHVFVVIGRTWDRSLLGQRCLQ
jgi:hypothetical protein